MNDGPIAEKAFRPPSPPEITYPLGPRPEAGEVVEAAEGVLWARMPLPMALDHVNIYAVDEADGWTLVDTGLRWGKGEEALAALLDGPLAGRPLRRVLVTHGHPDHIGLAGRIMARTGAELWTTRTAWLTARMLQLDHQDLPNEQQVEFMRQAGASADWLEAYRKREPFNFSRTVAPIPLGFQRIADGEVLDLGGRRWRIVTGEGHAPEHATLWTEDLAIAGDQILPRISSNLGVYPSEPLADPVTEWITSCRKMAEFATPEMLILPGHNEPFRGAPFRLDALIANHEGALQRLTAFLAEPRRAVDCFVTLFKREIKEAEFGLALSETVAHLNCLYQQGVTVRTQADDGAILHQTAAA